MITYIYIYSAWALPRFNAPGMAAASLRLTLPTRFSRRCMAWVYDIEIYIYTYIYIYLYNYIIITDSYNLNRRAHRSRRACGRAGDAWHDDAVSKHVAPRPRYSTRMEAVAP